MLMIARFFNVLAFKNAWPAEGWPSTKMVMESGIHWFASTVGCLVWAGGEKLIHVHLMPEQIGNVR